MTIEISLAKMPKTAGLDLSQRYDADAVAASEKAATDRLAALIADNPHQVLVHPITSAGFDGDYHHFAVVLALSTHLDCVYRRVPLPQSVDAVYLCRQAARAFFRDTAGDSLRTAEEQLSETLDAVACAQRKRDEAFRAVSENDRKKRLKLQSGLLGETQDLMSQAEGLMCSLCEAEEKLRSARQQKNDAEEAVRLIQTQHAKHYDVYQRAACALSLTLSELLEKFVAPLRKSHAEQEPRNSKRYRRRFLSGQER